MDFIHRVIPTLIARHGVDHFCRIRIDRDHRCLALIVDTEHGNHIIGTRRNILNDGRSFRINGTACRFRLNRQRLYRCLRHNMNPLALLTGNIGKQQHTQTRNGKQGKKRHNQQTGIKMPLSCLF
ncbi:pepSY-associated TM helix family domain protein [Neisseria meningitidis 2005040]|nr:pepSY-associated TM helix family domain protein [Neisseria meningitidis 2005040]